MRNKLSLAALSAVFALFVFSSCQKEGDTGPQGEPGPAGPQGPQGPEGPQGDTGVANVIYSEWLDVTFEMITDTADNGDVDTLAFVAGIEAPKLDQSILESGEIKVYVNAGTPSEPAVFPLPLFDAFELTGIFNMNAYFTDGAINLYSTNDGSTFETDEGEPAFQYRYVLIPGGVLAVKPDNVKLESYSDMQKFLQLKD